MSDQIYNNLPKDLVAIIAHQETRNNLLKALACDIVEAQDQSKLDEVTKKNLNAKCHSLLEEWMASKSPKILLKIPFREISTNATKIIASFMSGEQASVAATFIKLNEIAYNFQLEMEKKYAK